MNRVTLRSIAVLVLAVLTMSTVGTVALSDVAGAADTRGVTSSQITIGLENTSSSWPDMATGVMARFARQNRAGGIFGRKLVTTGPALDDGDDPSKALSNVQSLVREDNAFGIIEASGVFEPQVTDFLSQNSVPYWGWGFEPGFCSSKWGYGFNGCTTPTPPAQKATGATFQIDPVIATVKAQTGKSASQQRWAQQAQDNVGGTSAVKYFGALIPARGPKVVYNKANIPAGDTTTDYTPYVQALMATNPTEVFVGMDFPTTVAFTAALKAAGYKGLIYNSVGYVPGVLTASPNLATALNSTYTLSQIPPQEQQSPAIKQFQKDLTAIGKKPVITFGEALGYWNADVMIQMIKAAGKNLTPTALMKQVNTAFTYKETLQGGIGAMTFPLAEEQQTPCGALLKIQGTAYKLTAPFACYKTIALK